MKHSDLETYHNLRGVEMAAKATTAITKRQAIRALEAKRDSLIVKKSVTSEELAKTRDQLKRARAK